MSAARREDFEVPSTKPAGSDPVLGELLGMDNADPAPAAPAPASTRPRMTVYISKDVQDALRAAAYWTRENLSDLLEQAALEKIRQLEEAHNEGRPFSQPPERLKRGRPFQR